VLKRTLTRLGWILGSAGCSLIPEDGGVSGQQKLQQNWNISLQIITAQVVLQLSAEIISDLTHSQTSNRVHKASVGGNLTFFN